MSKTTIREAYFQVCRKLDQDAGLVASVRLEMCRILSVDPWQIEEMLTDDVIEFVLFG